jgi:hypothetical protein
MTWPWAFAGSALALSVAWIAWSYYHYTHLDKQKYQQWLLEADKSETGELWAQLRQAQKVADRRLAILRLVENHLTAAPRPEDDPWSAILLAIDAESKELDAAWEQIAEFEGRPEKL